MQEARRVLKDEGQLLITMINPVVGFVVHKIRHRYDLDQLERGMGEEEANGLWEQGGERASGRERFSPHSRLSLSFLALTACILQQKDAQ